MKKRTSFVFYIEWARAIAHLDETTRCSVYDAIVEYEETGEVRPLSESAATAFAFIRLRLDENNEKFEQTSQRRAEAGKRGLAKRWNNTNSNDSNCNNVIAKNSNDSNCYNCYNEIANVAENENENDNENVIKKESNKERKRGQAAFAPPSIDEVQQYVKSKGYDIDAEAFIAYYESNGWRVGRNPMKNWRSAVITWSRREHLVNKPAPPRKSIPEPDEW